MSTHSQKPLIDGHLLGLAQHDQRWRGFLQAVIRNRPKRARRLGHAARGSPMSFHPQKPRIAERVQSLDQLDQGQREMFRRLIETDTGAPVGLRVLPSGLS